MGSFDWKGLLGKIAPAIATGIGGPLAGGAVKFLAGALLGDENASEAELSLALQNASPETIAKIKEIDANYNIEMKRLDIDLEEMAYKDTANARKMATDTNMIPQVILSAVFIVGYMIILYVLISGNVSIHADLKDMVLILLGLITREIPTIMQFWFGSSHGSKKKDQ